MPTFAMQLNPINSMANSCGEIIEIYRGVPVREYPQVIVRVSVSEMKKIIDAKLDKGLSAKEAIKEKMIFCKECRESTIVKFNS